MIEKNGYLILFILTFFMGCEKYDKFVITDKPFVDKTSVELFVGEYAGNRNKIKLKTSPVGRNYKWTSMAPDVATVDQSGMITAHSEGLAVIAVQSENDFTNVNVLVKEFVPLTGFTLSQTLVNGFWMDMFQVLVLPIPENATEVNAQWSSSNENVAIVYSNGLIKITGMGECMITANINGLSHSVTVKGDMAVTKFPRGKWTVPGFNSGLNDGTIGYSSHHPPYLITNLFDGSSSTFWHASYSTPAVDFPHWFIVDMKRSVVVTEVMMQRRQGYASTNGFYLFTCPDVMVNINDPINGYPWVDQGEYGFNGNSNEEQRIVIPNHPEARYIKVFFDTKHKMGSNYIQLAEFAVYGY